jgi:hypothetical protein
MVYTMSMDTYKYLLDPEVTYYITFQDYDGLDFHVPVLGKDIISQLRRSYVIDNLFDHLLEDFQEPSET